MIEFLFFAAFFPKAKECTVMEIFLFLCSFKSVIVCLCQGIMEMNVYIYIYTL